MAETNKNPFNVTKAVDYSDQEIEDFWVDLPSIGFHDIIKPTSPMPMIILGGKGSGKTHIMRYFSYNLQKIRYNIGKNKSVENEGYLGIYMRCGGLNAQRFSKKNLDLEQWHTVFSYYMELWLAQLVLGITEDYIQALDNISNLEHIIVQKILQLFDKEVEIKINNLAELRNYIGNLQKGIDYQINNLAFKRSSKIENFEILVSPGKFIFGIPKILTETIIQFKDVLFLYLVDEYENLEEYQQKYFNTLIREREFPTTFKVGTRLYGMKTYMSLSGGEEIKEGSEYERFDIDHVLRDSKDYDKYLVDICKRKLERSNLFLQRDNIKAYFEDFSISKLFIDLSKKQKRDYIDSLRSQLKSIKLKAEAINKIIDNLLWESDYLIERTNIFLFYREWSNKNWSSLLSVSEYIRKEALSYCTSLSKDTLHYKVLEKYKFDIIDQICRENHFYLPYYGFDNLVHMSSGIPRILLKTLKEIYKQSAFNGEEPFKQSIISIRSQMKGLELSSKWFLSDAAHPGSKKVELVLMRLGRFLQELRFSNIPPECSINLFSLNVAHIDDKMKLIIDELTNYSYIVKVDERRAKNSNDRSETYHINGILASIWELSLSKRGVISFNKDEIDAIFGDQESIYDEVLKKRIKRYNAPFSTTFNQDNTLPLF